MSNHTFRERETETEGRKRWRERDREIEREREIEGERYVGFRVVQSKFSGTFSQPDH